MCLFLVWVYLLSKMPCCYGSFGEKIMKIQANEAQCVEDEYDVADKLCDIKLGCPWVLWSISDCSENVKRRLVSK